MPDIRVTITPELRLDLKVMALDQGKTLTKLVTDILETQAASHHAKKAFDSKRKKAAK